MSCAGAPAYDVQRVRENHSTYMALLKLVDKVSNQLDNKNCSMGIFNDLSKTSDTLDHNILNTLDYYGVRGTVNKCFLF